MYLLQQGNNSFFLVGRTARAGIDITQETSFIILEFITNPYFGYGFYANVAEAGKEME